MDKQCSDCKQVKDISEFGKRAAKKDGISAYCKACLIIRSNKYREINADKIKESNKAYIENNKDKLSEKNKKWREANKEKIQEYAKEYRSQNKERRKEWFSNWVKNNPERMKELKKRSADKNKLIERERKLKKFYGMSLEQFNTMSESQGHKCTICKKDASLERNKNLVVDHCHKTGMVRSLLCDRCNRTMGALEENIDVLENMIKYIREYEEKFAVQGSKQSCRQDLTGTEVGTISESPLDANRECLTESGNGEHDGYGL